MLKKYSFEMEEITNPTECPCRQYSETKGFCYFCGITQDYCGANSDDSNTCPFGIE